ncbi:hypothetical protein BJY01DRAFT_208236 [Aspergillus pseudoustus]|uniref:Uncharacterized protein n=1 Tax=Aspergillus pseudoustus TaxID=1810923 RepID=A0ABR4KKR4_9EURO
MLEADDHPFHHRNLSLAQCDGPGTDCNTEPGEEPAREPDSPDPSELPAWVAEIMGEDGMATTTLDSAKPSRPDSYHTCASRPQGTSRQAPNVAAEGAPCSLEPTQSTAPTIPQDTPTGENSQPEQGWGDVARRARALLFRCCYGGSEDEPIPQPTGATQDSYVTARNQVSSESQQPQLEDQTGP